MDSEKEFPKKRDECHHLRYEKEMIGFMSSGDRICKDCGMVFVKMAELKEAQEDAVKRLGPPDGGQ